MKVKVIAGLLLAVSCICLFAVNGSSQPNSSPPPPPDSGTRHLGDTTAAPMPAESRPPVIVSNPTSPAAPIPAEGSLEQLVQQLHNVRKQQKELAAQEEELLAKIARNVEGQRKALQKAEELLRQLRQEKDGTKQDRQDIPEKKILDKGGPDHNP